MDALSDILQMVRLTGGAFCDAEFSAPWRLKSRLTAGDRQVFPPGADVVCCHYIVAGRLLARTRDQRPVELDADTIILFSRGGAHDLGSGALAPPIDAHDLIRRTKDNGLAKISHGGGGEKTRLISGFFEYETRCNPLLAALPAMLAIKLTETPGGDWIARSIQSAAREIACADPGGVAILTRVSELLVIEAIRRYLATRPSSQTGWVAGLRDPAVALALALLHSRLGDEWTTTAMARRVGLSRSAFAQRFTALVGVPPMGYLARIRLQAAAQKLGVGRLSIAEAAFDVGYDSAVSFTRAFKREFGASPGAWRRLKSEAAKQAPNLLLTACALMVGPVNALQVAMAA